MIGPGHQGNQAGKSKGGKRKPYSNIVPWESDKKKWANNLVPQMRIPQLRAKEHGGLKGGIYGGGSMTKRERTCETEAILTDSYREKAKPGPIKEWPKGHLS